MNCTAVRLQPQHTNYHTTVLVENLTINTFYPDGFLEELEILCKQYSIGEYKLIKEVVSEGN
jgi:hypothetical protein